MVVPALVEIVGPKVGVVVGDLPVVGKLMERLEVGMLVELLEVDIRPVDSTVLEVVVDTLVLGAVGKRMDCRVVA